MSDVFFTDWEFPINATGAVPRTMPDRHADVINVMDFGADNTGGDDCQPAFAAAIAAATPSFNGGGSKACGTVYVPRGIYKFDSPVELLPGGPDDTFNSFRIVGETADVTQLNANFNGYIFDAGEDPYEGGGFEIAGFKLTNSNTTPFTSGCIRVGGIAPSIHDCWLGGMVDINLQGAKAAFVRSCYLQGILGDPGEGTIGINLACEGATVQDCAGQLLDVVFALSGTGLVVQGCHAEVCRRFVVTGYQSPGEELGYGYARGVVVQSCQLEALAIVVDVEGPTRGYFAQLANQSHSGELNEINPNPDSTTPNLCLWGYRIQDGMAESLTFDVCGHGSADVCDPDGGVYTFGLPPEGQIRTGGCIAKGVSGGNSGPPLLDQFQFPGSAGGGAAVAGAANSVRMSYSQIHPIWSYDDLPWGTLTSASITDSTLTYSSATRLTLEVGAVLSGADVTPGTKVTEILTSTTATVDVDHDVASTTMIFYCNNPGDEYQIGDSVDPLWTGSVSNAGKPITVGGGDERVTVMFKETEGYVIIG